MMKKQTVVEWLVNEIKESIGLKDLSSITKAKEMEKQQNQYYFNKGQESITKIS